MGFASMKPEHFCSGNTSQASPKKPSHSRFNEAGAFLLRKRCTRPGWPPAILCFNEAGAFLLRKPPYASAYHFLTPGRFNEAGAFLLRKLRTSQRCEN